MRTITKCGLCQAAHPRHLPVLVRSEVLVFRSQPLSITFDLERGFKLLRSRHLLAEDHQAYLAAILGPEDSSLLKQSVEVVQVLADLQPPSPLPAATVARPREHLPSGS